MSRLHQNSISGISRFKIRGVLICVSNSCRIISCAVDNVTALKLECLPQCLFCHFRCLQLLARIKTHGLGILHQVNVTLNKTVYASVLNNLHCCTFENEQKHKQRKYCELSSKKTFKISLGKIDSH